MIELITSFFTGKKKVLLNGTVIYQDKGYELHSIALRNINETMKYQVDSK